MLKTCVFLNGQLINIGEWDYQYETIDGEEVAQNPLPEGAIVEQREITQNADGGWVLSSDYASLRKAEYPPLADQLDALWKGEPYHSQMQAVVLAVKAKYPKSE